MARSTVDPREWHPPVYLETVTITIRIPKHKADGDLVMDMVGESSGKRDALWRERFSYDDGGYGDRMAELVHDLHIITEQIVDLEPTSPQLLEKAVYAAYGWSQLELPLED